MRPGGVIWRAIRDGGFLYMGTQHSLINPTPSLEHTSVWQSRLPSISYSPAVYLSLFPFGVITFCKE